MGYSMKASIEAKKSHEGRGMTSMRSRQRLINQLKTQGINNEDVLEVMLQTPRHIFLDSAASHHAYDNIAVPIGWNQTISQPYIVAKITSLLIENLKKLGGKRDRVLEVGSGCGYQAAILAPLFKEVYAVERINSLYAKGIENINNLGLKNVRFSHRDGNEGWDEYAPFDAIVVSAATADIPENLIKQLSSFACLLVPIGDSVKQTLSLVTKSNSEIKKFRYDSVLFVPMLEGLKY